MTSLKGWGNWMFLESLKAFLANINKRLNHRFLENFTVGIVRHFGGVQLKISSEL